MKARFDRREFLKAGTAGALLCALPQWLQSATAVTSRRPNIILILADDLGIPGIGCYGGEFATPNLDALAKGGARFDRCYSQPLCAPSRATLMTGRFPFRTGVVSNSARLVTPQRETIVPKMLKQAGYATALAGKWSQMAFMSTEEEAKAWGFDEFLTWDGAEGGRYWKPSLCRSGKSVAVTDSDYGPDMLNDYVLDFVRRKKDEPFFVYYPLTLIHSRLEPTPGAKTGKGLLADNIAYMDKLVGKLVAGLDALNLRESTLLIFAGDNGLGSRGEINGRPISGDKGSMLEGGSRVPLIANWKGKTPAGTVVDDLIAFSDFYATFADIAGGQLPEDVTMDSTSFAPQLAGQAGRPREWVFVQLQDEWYVCDKRWKLTHAGALFDLKDAPFKEIPVPADATDPDAVAARRKLRAVLDELKPNGSKQGDHRAADTKPGERTRIKKPR